MDDLETVKLFGHAVDDALIIKDDISYICCGMEQLAALEREFAALTDRDIPTVPVFTLDRKFRGCSLIPIVGWTGPPECQ